MLPRLAFLLFLFLLLSTASNLLAQEVFGSISGVVRDSQGAVVGGASVRAVQTETAAHRATTSDSQGAFSFPDLPIGTYDVTVEKIGFKQEKKTAIELHISDHLGVDFKLQLGDVSQQVVVNSSSESVETESGEQSSLISGEQARELQLNGRSFMTLLELLPGVASNMPDRVDPSTAPAIQINGARSTASNFNIDGGSNNDVIVGSSSLNTFTSIEQISEFKVITATFAAEYGRGGFSQVNVVTRGGTRQFHGSLYEFVRNDAFDARDYFTHHILPLKLNNFGYTLGGPVFIPGKFNRSRSRTFFFVNQEFNLISAQLTSINTTVPPVAERTGDFSQSSVKITDPTTKAAFPNKIIPLSRMDPNALKLIQLYPLPNFSGLGAINYTSEAPSHQNFREDMVRIDQSITDNWKLFGRYSQDHIDVTDPYGGTALGGASASYPGIANTSATRPGRNAVINMTNIFSPTLFNELSLNYSYRVITQTPVASDVDRATLGINIPQIFPHAAVEGDLIPTVALNSNYASLVVTRNYLKRLFNLEFSDNLTRVMERHTFKFGATYSYGGNRENDSSVATNGSYSFNTSFAGDPVANMLLGLPNSYAEARQSVIDHTRFAYVEAYAQDDFKITPRLTLNYGVRYSAFFNPWDVYNELTNFDPSMFSRSQAPIVSPSSGLIASTGYNPQNGIIVAGVNSPFGRNIANNNLNLLAPRFGFAFDPLGDKKTAIRGGYGIFYTRPLIGTFINDSYTNPPFERTVTTLQPPFSNPGAGGSDNTVPNLIGLGLPLKAPGTQQWSFGIQRELWGHAILNVAYVGSHGTHLMRPLNLNDPPAGLAAKLKASVNAVRPYSGYGSITIREDTATSDYHGLQVSFNRRIARKISLTAAYTFSKSIDNGSSERGGSDVPPDSSNANLERGLSDFDRRHVFTASYIYDLPNVTRNRAAGLVMNGWELSGITRLYTGNPFDVQLSTDVAGIGETQNQRPTVISNPNNGPHTTAEWFNIYAFLRPSTGAFGDMGRNTITGPGVNKWDFSLFKNFRMREASTLQFRAEAFNAPNHPSFGLPATSLTTTATGLTPTANSFGVITSTRDARVMQFALKLSF